MTRPAVVDFFSGCGGTSVGLRSAGATIAVAIDNDPDAAATFQRNFPEARFIERDIRSLDVNELEGYLPDGPLLFAGCAPCQPFSNQNRQKRRSDERRPLLGEFQRFVERYQPEYVIVENVPGLQRIGDKGPLPAFEAMLKQRDYDVKTTILRVGDYGVPQQRRRLILVASRVGPAALPVDVGFRANVRSAIDGLPAISAGEQHPDDPDHRSMKLSPLNLERIRATPEGGGRFDWPDHLVLDCHKNHTGHSDVYGRMSWDEPASGLTTKCLSYSNGRFGHPDQDRAISAREAALLQTFPQDFMFEGPLSSKGRQIGNAVPPRFAEAVGLALFGHG